MYDEAAIQLLMKAKYAGAMPDTSTYLNLVIQASAVLVGGIVMWRMSARYHKKKVASRERNPYFESTYSRNWKRK
jgi:hypothetical protein